MSDEATMQEAQPQPAPSQSNEPEVFDRSYVEQLRKEAAERRVALKQYEDAFSIYDPEVKEAWLQIIKEFPTNPQVTAQQLVEFAKQFLVEDDAEIDTDTDSDYLTKADLDRLLSEREARLQEQLAVKELQTEAKQLGYDPDSLEYVELLWVARNETGGDLAAAHAKLKERQEAIIKQYLEEKEKQSEQFPKRAALEGRPPGFEQMPKDLREARRSMEERLKALFG